MNHWIVVAAPYKGDGESFSAREIFERRMADRFWGLGANTGHRQSLKQGDRAVFYIARPESAFSGTARLASDSLTLSPAQTEQVSHGTDFFAAEYGVRLEEVDLWATLRPVAPLAPQLTFIRNPHQWWTYLQGGLHLITAEDYARIVGRDGRQDAPAYAHALGILRRVLADAQNGRDQEIERILDARDQVIPQYQPIFSPDHIPELTAEEFTSFLQFRNNQHWTGINRWGGIVTQDVGTLKRTLSLLLDESVPIRERIDAILGPEGTAGIRGLAKAVITPILLIAYPDQYGVWNTPAEQGMRKVGLWPAQSGDTVGTTYERVNALLQRIAGDIAVDLWTLDALWWRVAVLENSEITRSEVTEDEFEEAVYTLEELDRSAPLDQLREVSVRTEQGFLRQHLFGKKSEHTCTICGRNFPVGLLRAAHIKRRAECSVEEKLDYKNNVTPMCTFGCDELFERGYIVVRNGRVAKGQWTGVTHPVQDYIAGIADRPCLPYYRGSGPYFDWHAGEFA